MTKRIWSSLLAIVVPHQKGSPKLPPRNTKLSNRGAVHDGRSAVPAVALPMFPTHVLGAAEGNAGDARHALEVQLLNGLASLLLVAGVDYGLGASGKAGVASLDIGLVIAGVVEILDLGLLNLLLGELLNSGIGHFDS